MNETLNNSAARDARNRNAPFCLDCGGALTITESQLFDSRFGIENVYMAAICSECGLEQLTPVPSQDELKRLYESHYNFGGERNTRYTSMRQRFLFSPLYRWWMKLDGDISFHDNRGEGRLLDIGCNEGRGLQHFRRNGWQAEGLELNDHAAAAARRLGFVVHETLVEDFTPPDYYDAVVLSNVLEHSVSPRQLMGHVRNLLRPDGEVWISCPNSRSMLRGLFGRYWINWHVPFHIVQFSQQTLSGLLRSTGFEIVSLHQETPALWVAHSLIARVCARPGKKTNQLRNPAMVAFLIMSIRGLLFPLLWAANRIGRGDCLVIRARRI